ncbi:MAG TPA: hypothetical protein VJJ25_04020 [Nitrosopumilaceae archaeon]|nr:hypothetical protein [Nitrosopumilaceae archaeon]
MTSKLLILIAIGAIGSVAGFGSLDTVINAYVQQFGATDHKQFTTPGEVHNVQIDWDFYAAALPTTPAFQFIQFCDLTFDLPVPAGTKVICHVSGHDANPTDDIVTGGQHGPIVGTGSVDITSPTRSVQVPITCVTDEGDNEQRCDVQEIEDVKIILIGKETTDVLLREAGFCSDGKDNDWDGLTDIADPECAPITP